MKPPEEIKRELVRQWLAKAEQDMGAIKALLDSAPPFLHPACFHAQQAAEKYLKAFLTWHQVEFPKTHVFGKLLDLMSQVDEALAASISGVTALTPSGVEVRYPGDIPEPTRAEAEAALELARTVRDAVRRALEECG